MLRFLAENYGDIRLDDDGMACRIYDFAVGRTASRDGLVENRVCGNRRQNIGQALALVNGENFGSHLVIVHRQVKHSCKSDSVHGTSAFSAGTSREMRPDYWRAKD